MSWINDAGHGGKDPGAVSHGNVEKVYTLEASLYVHNRLLEHGIASSLTRSSDVTLEETYRVSKVSNYKNCLSHHFNAGGGVGAEFIHSIHGNGQFEHVLADEFKRAGYPVRRVFFKESDKYKGNDYYYMHRRTGSCKTTIVEYDFVDGANSEKIKDKAYREGMYECVVRSVCRKEEIAYKPLKIQEVEEMLEKAIVINGFPDMAVAEVLAARLKAPIYTRAALPKGKVAKELYVVGGTTTGLEADKIVPLTGKDRFEVAAKVAEFLK
jgi:N-acetylmuramoyl-L-alanine amidase